MISCKTATEQHTDAREGALGTWGRLRYQFHMAICPSCKAYEKGLTQTIDALAEVAGEGAPEAIKQAALAKLRSRS